MSKQTLLMLSFLATAAMSHQRAEAFEGTASVSIQSVTVDFDGSIEPPGDLVRIVIADHGQPDQQDVTVVEVRAFAAPDDKSGNLTPVRSSNPDTQDKDGNFLRRQSVDINKEQLTKLEMVIPFGDLVMERGQYRFGYEVTCLQNQTRIYSTATPLSTLVITDEPRTQIAQVIRQDVEAKEIIPIQVFQDGKLAEDSVTVTVVRQISKTQLVNVNIPHGFIRHHTYAATYSPGNHTTNNPDIPFVPSTEQSILYATNRDIVNANARDASRFGRGIDPDLHYGSCLVTVPVNHRQGTQEDQPWWHFGLKSPDEFFSVDALSSLTLEDWYKNLGENPNDVLLYVHGFQNSFEDGALRLGQIGYDIRFAGQLVLYSWASAATLPLQSQYDTDAERAGQSVDGLRSVLETLVENRRTNGRPDAKIHIVAHSMGNQVLLQAVNALVQGNALGADESPFGHVVFAAPDVDPTDFRNLCPALVHRSRSLTMYYCADDIALKASYAAHDKHTRVGQAPVVFGDGSPYNVDAQNVGTSFFALNHAYIANSPRLLTDLELLLNENSPPVKRPTLRPAGKYKEYDIWKFP
jgi:esterase/lipase superfamily enzyme